MVVIEFNHKCSLYRVHDGGRWAVMSFFELFWCNVEIEIHLSFYLQCLCQIWREYSYHYFVV